MWKRLFGLRQPHASWFASDHCVLEGEIELTYLGTAGFVVRGENRTVVLDPFLTRPSLRVALTQPLRPNVELIRKHLPQADEVLIGHAHYDHILDAPDLCKHTGARLIGSRATCNVGRAAGLPEAQLVETDGGEDIACGCWTVRGIRSRHGKAFNGRIPFPGDIRTPPRWPARIGELKHGQVLNWLVDTGSLRILHIDSAEFLRQELAQVGRVDVVCLCAIGRQHRPNYVQEVVELVQPRWIVPCHWDTMITPLESPPDLLPGVDLPGFLAEIRAAGVEPVAMPMLGTQRFSRRVLTADTEPITAQTDYA